MDERNAAVQKRLHSKKLVLTDEQKAKFLPLYTTMDEEIRKAQGETEKLYRQTLKKRQQGHRS